MLSHFAFLACLVHSGHGLIVDRHQSPKFNSLYESKNLTQKPQSICYTYMKTVLVTLPPDTHTRVKDDDSCTELADGPCDPTHSLRSPDSLTTTLSKPQLEDPSDGHVVANTQTLINTQSFNARPSSAKLVPGQTMLRRPSTALNDGVPSNSGTRTVQNQPSSYTEEALNSLAQIKTPMLPALLGITNVRGTTLSQLRTRFVGDPSSGAQFDCSAAQTFFLGNGRLQSAGKDLSVDPGAKYVDLTNHPEGTINSSFFVAYGFLTWQNDAFYGGTARFCEAKNGHIYATFTASGGPADCARVYLTVHSAKMCKNGAIVDPTAKDRNQTSTGNSTISAEDPSTTGSLTFSETTHTITSTGNVTASEGGTVSSSSPASMPSISQVSDSSSSRFSVKPNNNPANGPARSTTSPSRPTDSARFSSLTETGLLPNMTTSSRIALGTGAVPSSSQVSAAVNSSSRIDFNPGDPETTPSTPSSAIKGIVAAASNQASSTASANISWRATESSKTVPSDPPLSPTNMTISSSAARTTDETSSFAGTTSQSGWQSSSLLANSTTFTSPSSSTGTPSSRRLPQVMGVGGNGTSGTTSSRAIMPATTTSSSIMNSTTTTESSMMKDGTATNSASIPGSSGNVTGVAFTSTATVSGDPGMANRTSTSRIEPSPPVAHKPDDPNDPNDPDDPEGPEDPDDPDDLDDPDDPDDPGDPSGVQSVVRLVSTSPIVPISRTASTMMISTSVSTPRETRSAVTSAPKLFPTTPSSAASVPTTAPLAYYPVLGPLSAAALSGVSSSSAGISTLTRSSIATPVAASVAMPPGLYPVVPLSAFSASPASFTIPKASALSLPIPPSTGLYPAKPAGSTRPSTTSSEATQAALTLLASPEQTAGRASPEIPPQQAYEEELYPVRPYPVNRVIPGDEREMY